MEAIDWSRGPYFLSVGIDLNNGTNFQQLGTTQLLSVPYALHANTAENITLSGAETVFSGWDKDASNDFSGSYEDLIGIPWSFSPNSISTANNIGIDVTDPTERLHVNGNVRISGNYSFTSPKTDYYHVGPSEFIARNNISGVFSLHGDQEYGSFEGIEGSWRAFATVHLPDGAIVNEVRVYYVDASSKNMTVYFRKTSSSGINITNLGFLTSAETDSPNQPIARQMAFNPNITIDNSNSRYTLIFESSENSNSHRLYNVRIRYTVSRL